MSNSISNTVTGAFLIACALLAACATPGAPSGGPRDQQPPQVVEEESSPNPMINFDLDEIRITFDEWVSLKDAATQIVISPPIEPRITPRINRKTVVISIDQENLKDSTTYVINFGEAVQDITERNPAKDLLYVFSTGSYVDSLSFSGNVFDALTGEGVEDVKVILHDNLSDTAVTTLLPSYFTTTDENGAFTVRFLRADTFKVYAVLEGDFGNYKYDFGEQMGFLDDPVIISDTNTQFVEIPLYTPETPLQIVSNMQGLPQKVAFTRAIGNPSIVADSSLIPYWRAVNDTVYVWYSGADTTDLVILEDGIAIDTVPVFPVTISEALVQVRALPGSSHPDEPVSFRARHPIDSIVESRVEVLQGDTTSIDFSIGRDSSDATDFMITADWEEQGAYTIIMLPGALVDIYGNRNDTLRLQSRFQKLENFGNLNLAIVGLNDSIQYVIQLMDKDQVVMENIAHSVDTLQWIIPRLPARNYTARMIEDVNENGRWDSGDLATKRQPERIFSVPVDGMRPGWDLDFEITWPEE